VEREDEVSVGETRDEVAFEGVGGSFGRISTVIVWRGKLMVDLVLLLKNLEECRIFIVCDLKAEL